MAIFYFHQSHISRSQGQSSVAFIAYITREQVTDERTGQRYDFRRFKDNSIYCATLTPFDAPDWAKDPQALWTKVENFEDEYAYKRYKTESSIQAHIDSAQTSLRLTIALPKSLPHEHNIELVEEFVKERFIERGLCATLAVHPDEGNPHAHIQVTLRALEGNSFAMRKERDLSTRLGLNETKRLWAEKTNCYLQRNGFEEKIDHRSYNERGLLFEGLKHVGYYSQSLRGKGEYSALIADNEAIQAKNAQIALNDPDQIIRELSFLQATFTERDIAKFAFKRVQGDEVLFEHVYRKALNSDLLVEVGRDAHGNTRYTTADYKEREQSLIELTQSLASEGSTARGKVAIEDLLETHYSHLNEGQKKGAQYLCEEGNIRCLIGRAGVGKTTLLGAVTEAYQHAGYRVIGMALAGAAAEELGKSIGVESRTIASWEYAWNKLDALKRDAELGSNFWERARHEERAKAHHAFALNSRDVLIIDEAGMVGVDQMLRVLHRAYEAKAKVLIIGDNHQFKAIEAGDALRAIIDTLGAYEVHETLRQNQAWMREASNHLGQLKIREGIEAYAEKGCLSWHHSAQALQEALIGDYLADRKRYKEQSQLILTYRRDDVTHLNTGIHQALRTQGDLKEGTIFKGVEFSVGEKIVFLKNDNKGDFFKTIKGEGQGVKNGTLATLIGFDGNTFYARIGKAGEERVVSWNTHEYTDFSYGYAVTEHKSQGATVDRVYVQFSKSMDAVATHVAMTRHKETLKGYSNHEEIADLAHLIQLTSRNPSKDLVVDYTIRGENRASWERVQAFLEAHAQYCSLFAEVEGRVGESHHEIWQDASWDDLKALKEKRQRFAKEIMKEWKEHELYIHQANFTLEKVEIIAGYKERPLKAIEIDAKNRVELYQGALLEARALWNTIKSTHPGALSREHPDYMHFESLRRERDSLAHTIAEKMSLHRRFLKETKVNQKTIQIQSDAHLKRMGIDALYQRLSVEQRQLFDEVKAYKAFAHETRQLWHASRQDEGLKEAWQSLRDQRDERAHFLKSHIEEAKPYLDLLNVNGEKLILEGQTHEIRAHIDALLKEKNPSFQLNLAQSLVKTLEGDDEHLTKITYGILKEKGLKRRALEEYTFAQARNGLSSSGKRLTYGVQKSPSHHSGTGFNVPTLSAEDIHYKLADRIESLAETLLGKPASKGTKEWRYGNKGSLVISLKGDKRGLFYDFEQGTGGGPLELITNHLHLNKQEAIKWAKEWLGDRHVNLAPLKSIDTRANKKPSLEWKPIFPVPENAQEPSLHEKTLASMLRSQEGGARKETARFAYRDQEGNLLGYVVRLEEEKGGTIIKMTPPLTYCGNDKGMRAWRWQGFGENRPLYGLERLHLNKPVLLVEGEKTADAAQKLFPDYAVLSWLGGAQGVHKADWEPLKGRDIVIWPDHDAPGLKAALAIVEILKEHGNSPHVVELPENLPPKWDLADPLPEGFTLSHLKALVSKDVALREEQSLDPNEAFILDYKHLCQKVREDFKILQESIKTEGFNETTLQRLEAWWTGCEKADNQALDIYNAQERYHPYLERHHITLEPEKEPLRRIQRHLGYERYDWSLVHQYQFLCKEAEFLNKDPNEDFGSAILLVRRQATAYQLYKDPSLLEESRARGLTETLEGDRKAFPLLGKTQKDQERGFEPVHPLVEEFHKNEKLMDAIGPLFKASLEDKEIKRTLIEKNMALAYEISKDPHMMKQIHERGLEGALRTHVTFYKKELSKQKDRDHGWEY